MIQFDKFTQKAQEAIQQAQSLAGKNQHQAIHPLHLLLALANEKEGVVRPVLEKTGVQLPALIADAERVLSATRLTSRRRNARASSIRSSDATTKSAA